MRYADIVEDKLFLKDGTKFAIIQRFSLYLHSDLIVLVISEIEINRNHYNDEENHDYNDAGHRSDDGIGTGEASV